MLYNILTYRYINVGYCNFEMWVMLLAEIIREMKFIQIKTFSEFENGEECCNEFLRTILIEDIVSVTGVYNTILGGIDRVVVYKEYER